jgi:hypothetical protein
VSEGTAAFQSLLAIPVRSWQMRSGTLREPRGRGMSAIGSCYQKTGEDTAGSNELKMCKLVKVIIKCSYGSVRIQ